MMLAHGFRREMLARLVLRGLATVTTTMRAGAATMKVERYRITDDGRKCARGRRLGRETKLPPILGTFSPRLSSTTSNP
jgi:hypothetical protein